MSWYHPTTTTPLAGQPNQGGGTGCVRGTNQPQLPHQQDNWTRVVVSTWCRGAGGVSVDRDGESGCDTPSPPPDTCDEQVDGRRCLSGCKYAPDERRPLAMLSNSNLPHIGEDFPRWIRTWFLCTWCLRPMADFMAQIWPKIEVSKTIVQLQQGTLYMLFMIWEGNLIGNSCNFYVRCMSMLVNAGAFITLLGQEHFRKLVQAYVHLMAWLTPRPPHPCTITLASIHTLPPGQPRPRPLVTRKKYIKASEESFMVGP